MEDALLTFGLIADLQYADQEPANNRFFRNSREKLRQAIEMFNARRVQFVIDLGDLIDRGWQHFDTILSVYNQLRCPLYLVPGNHDFEVDDAYKVQVLARLGHREGWMDFAVGPWRFILLNGADVSTFAHLSGHPNHRLALKWMEDLSAASAPNGNPWNGGIGEEQMAWLTARLAESAAKGERVIALCHYPIFPAHRHNLLNDLEILRLLREYPNAAAWFCGHNHEGGYARCAHLHHVNLKGAVDTEHDTASCIVHVYSDRLELEGFGQEVSRSLSIFSQ
jgi:predicted phosphodiesterase